MPYSDFAVYYDSLTQNVEYEKLADYIEQLLAFFKHESGICLDLACGTGTLTVEMKKRGHDIYGIDSSPEMLSVACQKAAKENLDILFLCQKMQSIDLYGTIDTCFCCLDSLNHLENINQVEKTFNKVSLFMNKGGYFIFDVNTLYKHKYVLANNTYIYDTENVYCIWQNEYAGAGKVNINLDFFEPDGTVYYRSSEQFSEKAYSSSELKALLEKAGFVIRAVFDERTFNPEKSDSVRLFFIAEKC